MTDFTSEDLLNVIKDIDSPYDFLQFFKQRQIATQRFYPSVEITNIEPESLSKTPQLKTYRTAFEINVFIRYAARTEDTENLRTIERNLIAAIQAATLNDISLILEENNFRQGPIRDNPLNVEGIQSTLTVLIEEREATVGIIGLQQTLSIGSIIDLQLISETAGDGTRYTRRSNDIGNVKINKGEKDNFRFVEYMYTKTNYDTIQALIDADNEISATIKEAGVSSTFTVKPVFQRSSVRFDGQKTTILELQIV